MKTEAPFMIERRPIKLTGKDIEGNDLELNFHSEDEPISIKQIQLNLNKRNETSISVTPRKPPYRSVRLRKSPYSPVIPRLRNVGVLTDRPPGTPSNIAQIQDVVNTVGPVPMTFGYGPNTFPHSAAHVRI